MNFFSKIAYGVGYVVGLVDGAEDVPGASGGNTGDGSVDGGSSAATSGAGVLETSSAKSDASKRQQQSRPPFPRPVTVHGGQCPHCSSIIPPPRNDALIVSCPNIDCLVDFPVLSGHAAVAAEQDYKQKVSLWRQTGSVENKETRSKEVPSREGTPEAHTSVAAVVERTNNRQCSVVPGVSSSEETSTVLERIASDRGTECLDTTPSASVTTELGADDREPTTMAPSVDMPVAGTALPEKSVECSGTDTESREKAEDENHAASSALSSEGSEEEKNNSTADDEDGSLENVNIRDFLPLKGAGEAFEEELWCELIDHVISVLPEGVTMSWDPNSVAELVLKIPSNKAFLVNLNKAHLRRKELRRQRALLARAEKATKKNSRNASFSDGHPYADLIRPSDLSRPIIVGNPDESSVLPAVRSLHTGDTATVSFSLASAVPGPDDNITYPVGLAIQLLEKDQRLALLRQHAVPAYVAEDVFWNEYFQFVEQLVADIVIEAGIEH